MSRYFLELAYKGTRYAGFQVQQNANSIQAEVEKALEILYKNKFTLTGSSRTDAGVHARQNFFHFDTDCLMKSDTYNLNAILPDDIVVKQLVPVEEGAHCRFDATSREYRYYIYRHKNPFLQDIAYYIPYRIDMDLLQEAAAILATYRDFTSFCKRNTQVTSMMCSIYSSKWLIEDDCILYQVEANRFLRGMVKGLVGTMLLVGKKKISLTDFKHIIEAKDCTRSNFSVPAKGLFLHKVNFKQGN